MTKYNPEKIEKKWQKYWETGGFYNTNDEPPSRDASASRSNYMLLAEFPYPSGNLHIGHWYAYSLSDISARYLRMNGKNVMYPIGFDAFGLPAENAAIKNNIHPEKWTKKNIAYMTKQLKSMGATFDWSRQVSTIDPEYYKWTQWMFLKFYESGLAYRAATKVNWCPNDKTVLANEQVIDGKCDRCKNDVVKKEMTQWMFKITNFADELVDGLEGLDWQETAKLGQKNWIGRSEGALVKFSLRNMSGQPNDKHSVEVFTTRPDTLFGVTFLVVSPELAQKWIDLGWQASGDVREYIKKSLNKKELERLEEVKEKTGMPSGITGVNPANKEEIPVWVADYVLGSYGTGAIMAVPAHDQRDYEFAKKFGLPIRVVIEPETGKVLDNEEHRKSIVAIVEDEKSKKFLTLNWGPRLGGTLFIGGGREDGEDEVATALREIKEETGYTDLTFVAKTELMHHHYFAFSKNVARNIEVVGLHFRLSGDKTVEKNLQHDEKGNFEIEWLVKEDVLRKMEDENHLLSFKRLLLGEIYTGRGLLVSSGKFNGMDSEKSKKEIVDFVKGTAKSQYRLHDWILSRQRYWGSPIPMVNCEKCGYVSVPEKDLPVKLPPLKDFRPADDGRSPLAKATKWLKVKCPNCGGDAERETDTMDTFVDSSWYFMRYTDPNNEKEFASKEKMKEWLPVPMYVGGAEHTTMHLLYARFFTKALHKLGYVDFDEPFLGRRNRGIILGPDHQKMSKSRGNVIDPDVEVKKFGADTIRMYLAFMGPYDQGGPWSPGGIVGVYRFLNRVWNLFNAKMELSSEYVNTSLRATLHKTIKKIGEDIAEMHYNTCVSELMKLLNEFEKSPSTLSDIDRGLFLKILSPFAPHLSEELWQNILGNKKSIHLEKWPEYDPELIKDEKIKLVVQINGKTRDVVEVPSGIDEDFAREAALTSQKVQNYLEGKDIKKTVFVKDRLINLII